MQVVKGSVVESAANTFTATKFEVPNSQGAISAVIRNYFLDVEQPDKVASTLTRSHCALMLGDKTALTSMPAPNADGFIDHIKEQKDCGSGPALIQHTQSEPVRVTRSLRVPRDENGQFFVTLMTKSVSNTGAKTTWFQADVEVLEA
jgi:hypothetical protein